MLLLPFFYSGLSQKVLVTWKTYPVLSAIRAAMARIVATQAGFQELLSVNTFSFYAITDVFVRTSTAVLWLVLRKNHVTSLFLPLPLAPAQVLPS